MTTHFPQYRLGRLGLILIIWGAFLAGFLPTHAAEEENSLAGSYRDDRVVVELILSNRLGSRTLYNGSVQLGEQKFPLKAEAQEGQLKGTFESQGDQFEFTGSIAGRMLVFTTDGTTYRLRKGGANPLAKPAQPNPLAAARTNVAASTSAPASGLALASLVASKPNALYLKRHSLMDDPNMIGGEAFSVLVPANWQVEGGLAWRPHPTLPAYLALRVSNPDRTEAVEVFPAIPFIWCEGGIPLFPPGSLYMGNQVAEPIDDPAAYVRQILLPRVRPKLIQPQIVVAEELPKVAAVIAETAQEPGLQKKYRAVRIRIEYVENSRTIEEDIYCVIGSVFAPAIGTTFWGPDRNYSFRAEKGKLEARTRLFQAIISSLRPNLQWFNRYVQLVQVLSQTQTDPTRRLGDLSQYVARTSDEMSEPRRQLYQKQQAAQDKINAAIAGFVPGLQEYQNPSDKRSIQLPAGYRDVWASASGEFLLSDDAGLNPNSASSVKWQKLGISH